MKITLTKPQHKVSKSNKRFRVLVSGRRFGKTYLCITEMMKYATQVRKNIWYVAPTFKMAREIVWSKLKQMLASFNWIESINETNFYQNKLIYNFFDKYTDPHSEYFGALANYGLIGFIIFLILP